jgi:serine/threonine-protein kinase
VPIVRQEAARLRKRLARYYETDGSADKVRIGLPVGTYVPVFQREFAESPIDPVEPLPVPHRRWWPYAAVALGCITVAFLAAWRITYGSPGLSVAVLPFVNASGDPANQYFVDGLADEITDSLARVKTLRVIARSSVSQFKGKTVDIRETGRLLNVTHMLEGSVERSADRIKVIAHLERVSDGSVIWSNTYERKASDLYAVQSELAAGIGGALKLAVGARANTHVPNGEAHDFYIKGLYDLQTTTPESITKAELDFRQAVAKDPEYARAYAGLASAKYDQNIAHGASPQTADELKEVQRLMENALELDPELSSAHAMLGLLAMQYDRDWVRAERELQLAMAGPPSPAANYTYAFFLLFHGRFAEADKHLARTVEIDPFSVQTKSNLALARQVEGRFREAREICQKAADENPKMLWAMLGIATNYISEGRPDLGLPVLSQLKTHWPPAAIFEAGAFAKQGRRDEALRLIRPFEEKYPNPGVPMYWIASVYGAMSDEPNALIWLQRSADQHEIQVLFANVDPIFAPMRHSPGFRALLKNLGLDR